MTNNFTKFYDKSQQIKLAALRTFCLHKQWNKTLKNHGQILN